MPQACQEPPAPFKFSGFASPNYTQIPDELFDELLPLLSGNDLKVLMYICRRTFGFKKSDDNISLSQMVNGITTRDGVKLDGGTGLSKASVARSLKSLEEMKIILRVRRFCEKKGDLPTTYCLNMLGQPHTSTREEKGRVNSETPRVSHRDTLPSHHETPRVSHGDTQYTELQQTGKQKRATTTAVVTPVSAPDSSVVVAQLTKLGIAKPVSETLGSQHAPEYIQQKIDYLRFLTEREKNRVKKPAAWLRSAIEKDFAAPDGYISPLERQKLTQQAEAEKNRKLAHLEAQKAHFQAGAQHENSHLSQALQRMYKRYQTGEREFARWEQVQPHLLAQGIAAALVGSLQLLRLDDGEAVLYVANRFMWERVTVPSVAGLVQAVLSQVVGHSLKVQYLVAENESQSTK